jgi:CBS domain-containing protein
MQIKDVMTTNVELVNPETSVASAAQQMREHDIGALPVGKDEKMIGMLTDRDIVVRVVADGRDSATAKVGEAMTPGVRYCFDDQFVDEVARNMASQQIRRLPVVNRDKRLVGIVSIADLAWNGDHAGVGEALESISTPV